MLSLKMHPPILYVRFFILIKKHDFSLHCLVYYPNNEGVPLIKQRTVATTFYGPYLFQQNEYTRHCVSIVFWKAAKSSRLGNIF